MKDFLRQLPAYKFLAILVIFVVISFIAVTSTFAGFSSTVTGYGEIPVAQFGYSVKINEDLPDENSIITTVHLTKSSLYTSENQVLNVDYNGMANMNQIQPGMKGYMPIEIKNIRTYVASVITVRSYFINLPEEFVFTDNLGTNLTITKEVEDFEPTDPGTKETFSEQDNVSCIEYNYYVPVNQLSPLKEDYINIGFDWEYVDTNNDLDVVENLYVEIRVTAKQIYLQTEIPDGAYQIKFVSSENSFDLDDGEVVADKLLFILMNDVTDQTSHEVIIQPEIDFYLDVNGKTTDEDTFIINPVAEIKNLSIGTFRRTRDYVPEEDERTAVKVGVTNAFAKISRDFRYNYADIKALNIVLYTFLPILNDAQLTKATHIDEALHNVIKNNLEVLQSTYDISTYEELIDLTLNIGDENNYIVWNPDTGKFAFIRDDSTLVFQDATEQTVPNRNDWFRLEDFNTIISAGPTAIKNIIYNTAPQVLVNSGNAINGYSFMYAVGDELPAQSEFSYNLPKATDAGTHTVWYKAVCSSPYSGTIASKLTVDIAKKKVSEPTVVGTYEYTASEQTVQLNGYGSYLTPTTPLTGTNAGTYNIEFIINDTDNYEWDTGNDGKLSWTITKQKLAEPTVKGTYTYNTEAQTVEFNGYDSTILSTTSTLTQTNAGKYNIKFNIIDTANYEWNSTSDGALVWRIEVRRVPEPVQIANGNPYNGEVQSATLKNYDTKYVTLVSGELTAKDVGKYPLVFKLVDTTNCNWDSQSDGKTSWSITKVVLAEPTVVGTYYYNGQPQTVVLEGYDPKCMKIDESEFTKTNAGYYDFTFVIDTTNYQWNNTSNGLVHWTINKIIRDEPRVVGEYIYNGEEQTVQLSGWEEWMVPDPATPLKRTDAGQYELRFIIDTVNYQWTNTSNGRIDWVIKKQTLTNPVVVGTYEYTGSAQTVVLDNYDENLLKPVTSLTQTNVGTYTLEFSIKDTKNYAWATGNKGKVSWTIGKQLVYEPTVVGTYVYNGSAQTVVLAGNDSTIMTTAGTTTATKAGTYTVSFKIINSSYKWAPGCDGSITWTILPPE